jgi:hypothetical protein
MSPALAISQLLETEESRGEGPSSPPSLPFPLLLLCLDRKFSCSTFPPSSSCLLSVALTNSASLPPSPPPSKPSPLLTYLPGVLSPDSTLAITVSRVGTPTQCFHSGTLAQLSQLPESAFGGPLHSLVLVGKRVHPLEVEYAGGWAVGESGEGAEVKKGEDGKRSGEWWRVAREVYGVELEGEAR